tara:strand:- start:19646 stop:20344 length:699 start_codon:yes stop_codon:yes gene_type:complete
VTVANETPKKKVSKKTSAPKTSSLMKALLKARKEIGPLVKDQKANMGRGGSYAFAGHEASIQHCNDVLLNNDLILEPESLETITSTLDIVERNIPLVREIWSLTHVETDEKKYYTRTVPIENDRTLTKGYNATCSTSWNYMLRDVLMIPRIEANQLEVDNDKGGEASAAAHDITPAQLNTVKELCQGDAARMEKIESQCRTRYGKPLRGINTTVAQRLIDHLRKENNSNKED